MKKISIIIFILFAVISALYLVFSQNIYDFLYQEVFNGKEHGEYLYGTAEGEKGRISLKIKVDNSGTIKEVVVTEHSDSDVAQQALQKLIDSSLDKQNADEIDTVTGATDTSNTYKTIISSLLSSPVSYEVEDKIEKISLAEPDVQYAIERTVVNREGFKSGIGGYVMNTFQDADYNRNGNLFTNEYICAVILNENNRIEQVKFDHIGSNISFDRFGKVPTGGAKAYVFTSDKAKSGFNGMINDGNYVNMYDFEKQVLTYRHFEEIKSRFIGKKGYAPLIYALENAIDNARFIGASSGDTLGLSVNKILKKRDIVDSTDTQNGKVNFISNYCLITTDKTKVISSCMFDNVVNTVTLTNNGKILGSREKEIYTLNELSNTSKYTKIDLPRYEMKLQLNTLGEFMRGNSIDNMLSLISEFTDDKGVAKPNMAFKDLKNIDFIEFIDLISRAYVDAVKISAD
ncbi:MAG: FMN-binding protein [Lachnospiraceae bacterium]|nr:FMN-binding protein [Lachnospiraceae bacterium]